MNGKGMVATMDAMIFVTVLALVSVTLFSFGGTEDRPPDASDVVEDLSRMTIDGREVFPLLSGTRISVWEYAAYSEMIGEPAMFDSYISEVMGDMLTERYGYSLTISYGDQPGDLVVTYEERTGIPVSECIRDIELVRGSCNVTLTIYA